LVTRTFCERHLFYCIIFIALSLSLGNNKLADMAKIEDWLGPIPSKQTRKTYRNGIKKFEEFYGKPIETLIGSNDAGKTIEKFYVWLKQKHPQNTCVYTHLTNLENNELHTDVADTVEKACKLIEAGFEYVTGEYNDGGKIFRKRK
jgi:hypothetical protein